MNLQQLHYFQKIAECQQYTQAAKELHVTQATLSYAISNLEKELDARLFERNGKSVTLTDCGKTYLACVNEALDALQRGQQLVKDATAQARSIIKLDCLESVKHLALRVLSVFGSGDPDNLFRLELSHTNASNIEQRLIRRETDLAISTAPSTSGISSHLIGYQDNVIIVPRRHDWSDQKNISLSSMKGQRMIAYTQDCAIRGYYDSILSSARVETEIFAEARSHSNILDMVSYGLGIAIVPRMKDLEDRYDLHVLNISDSISPRAIYLLWAENSMRSSEFERLRHQIIDRCALSSLL